MDEVQVGSAGGSTPADRIIAVADIKSTGFGYHALVPYLKAFGATLEATRLPPGILGRSHVTPDGYLIQVDVETTPSRRWFTVAHEVAHMLVDEAHYDLMTHSLVPTNDIALERLCDDIAGRILLPTDQLHDLAPPVLRSGSFLRAAHECEVSAEAFSIRLNEAGYPNVFARLRCDVDSSARWSPKVNTGRAPSLSRLNWNHICQLPLGTTQYIEPAANPEWGISHPVVGEVRKGTSNALVWFSHAR